QSIITAKRGKPGWKLHGVRAQMRAAFPAERYRQRVHAETVFSAIKRKLSAKAPGRSLTTQRKQALLLGLAYNIYKLWPPQFRSLLPCVSFSTEPSVVYVVFGGAKFRVTNPAGQVSVVPDGALLQVPDIPQHGTLLKGQNDS